VVARPAAQSLRAAGLGRPQGPPLQRDFFAPSTPGGDKDAVRNNGSESLAGNLGIK